VEDPFNIGFKGFFGVATGIGILVLTFNFIQSIDSAIENYKDNQERKERLIIREKERKERKKYLENFSNDVMEDFR
tara:strand:- start:360 stop:587 length:228 start_codon:yes stop_codon:yes gene_type:complete